MKLHALITLLTLALFPFTGAQTISGPLRVGTANPRYFTDDSGRAIYLTGSHTWYVLRDSGTSDPSEAFDYSGFLDLLTSHGHNFMRLWVWDLPSSQCGDNPLVSIAPFPWPRTGPGLANDGKPKFDLSKLDESYFTRLRERVIAARDRGIYAGVMFFDGYGIQFCRPENDGHPFDAANNINGISPASNTHTMNNPAALAVQKAYVRKVVDTINDLDNVLYEIANEAGGDSTAWQFEMIDTLNQYQATKPRRHPVGMTYQHAGGDNATLFASSADWISPGGGAPGGGAVPYGTDPPAADGSKVILSDTDHIWGTSPGADSDWVWRSFTRGLNPIYMDPVDGDPAHTGVRRAMGQTLGYARRLDLVNTTPRGDLASTAHCLANPGSEIVVYKPGGGAFTVNLGATAGTYRVEWFQPATGAFSLAPEITASGTKQFTPPFGGDAVLYLRSIHLPAEESIDVRITDPIEGETYGDKPAAVAIRATASDRYGMILQVELLADGQLLGVSEAEPHDVEWNDVPPGSYTLTARATNDANESLVSHPVRIFVGSQPEIHSFSVDEGIASFLLRGEISQRYRVEVSEDLAAWVMLIETSMISLPGVSGGAAVIVDAASPDHPRRFYRAIQIP
jgi:hypothetical protein